MMRSNAIDLFEHPHTSVFFFPFKAKPNQLKIIRFPNFNEFVRNPNEFDVATGQLDIHELRHMGKVNEVKQFVFV